MMLPALSLRERVGYKNKDNNNNMYMGIVPSRELLKEGRLGSLERVFIKIKIKNYQLNDQCFTGRRGGPHTNGYVQRIQEHMHCYGAGYHIL